MTRFFIPGNAPARSEEIYQWLVTYVNAVLLDCQVDPIRIYSLAYRHEGQQFRATVGDVDSRTGQLVIAILRADTYLICTPYYGVERGEPIPVGFSEADEVQYFEGLGNALEALNLAVKALDSDAALPSRLGLAALALEHLGIDDFPATIVPDFISLKYKLTWRGDREGTLDRMTEAEGGSAAAAIRALYVHVLADWTRMRGGI